MTYTADQLIAKYVEIRDERNALSERHKAEMVPLTQSLDVIEGALMNMLNEQGGQSIKTGSGTAYRSEVMTCKVEDWDSFFYYVQRFNAQGLLVRNVNKTAVKEMLDAGQSLPPGVSTQTIYNLNVRRA